MAKFRSTIFAFYRLLRSAAVVKGLRFPEKVRNYFETMMTQIGYQPLPAV